MIDGTLGVPFRITQPEKSLIRFVGARAPS
jgi:hypothetical protein